jgi:hypothetical protein
MLGEAGGLGALAWHALRDSLQIPRQFQLLVL